MSTSIPPPPKHGGSGPFILAAVAMLLLMGGLIFWKMNADEEVKTPPPPPVTTNTAPPVLDEPPPPPPPPEEVVDAGVPEKQPIAKRPVTSSVGCAAATCPSQVPSTLQAQLRAKAGQARPCYERALRQNSHLQGRMMVSVRIAENGSVCRANVTSNELGDPGVASCVVQMFRSSTFAAPQGGCADVQVPLNFTPKT